MVDLTELAKRVEGLVRGDREVDGLIACAIFKTVTTGDDLIYLSPICKSDECVPGTYWLVQRSGRSLQTAPVYTASLDAAMSLLGRNAVENMTYWPFVAKGYESEHCCRITVLEVGPDGFGIPRSRYSAEAATPALALTAAALRARARLQEPRP